MRKIFKKIIVASLCSVLAFSLFPTNFTQATGNGQSWDTLLGNSGSGGSVVRYNSVTGVV
ncbi:hypothetical protein [Oceanobacillus halotolerans]|uniref:hypothetical protein n=1 Tax=Oceanobacillus halotolerans TaxID=2663380 RepID=UPI0013DA0594|nr:hypothetical protein [Oceanobacillus halotolerans]